MDNFNPKIYKSQDPSCVLSLDGRDVRGSKIYDRSGKGNHGAITGAILKPANYGLPVLEFDGVDDNVDAGNDVSLSITSEMTIEAWMMPLSNNSNKGIVTKSQDDNLNRWFLYITTSAGMGQIAFGMNIGGAGWVSAGSGIIPEINHWYHIIATRDSTNYLSIYVNGVYKNGVQGYSGSPDAPIRIGKYFYSVEFFNGSINSVCIFKHAFSSFEVSQRFNANRQKYGI